LIERSRLSSRLVEKGVCCYRSVDLETRARDYGFFSASDSSHCVKERGREEEEEEE
jgi:hypothetical protein